MIRSFLPVGQGAFYVEQFKDGTNVVYDCGSLTGVKYVEREIKSVFEQHEDIAAVFISHMHADHVNGLKTLFSHCNVKRLYLPYLTPDTIFLTGLEDIVNGGEPSDFLTKKFYKTASDLDSLERCEEPFVLFRGFRIEHITETGEEALLDRIRTFNDKIPSSASWTEEVPNRMSSSEENKDSVVLRLIIEPGFPVICLSYPDNDRRISSGTPAIDIHQAEVLIGAYRFTDISILKRERLNETSTKYVVECHIQPEDSRTVLDRIVAVSPYLQERIREKQEAKAERAERERLEQEHKQQLSEAGLEEINILPYQLNSYFDEAVVKEILEASKAGGIYIGGDRRKYRLVKIAYRRTFETRSIR